MISLCDFHTQVLGCSHKGDRWAVKKMGLVTLCPREKERDVYQPLYSYTLTHILKLWWCSSVLFTMFGERR